MMHLAHRLGRIKRAAASCMLSAARLLFPPICLGCRRIVAAGGTLCARCWSSIHFLEEPWCAISGVPFQHDMGARAVSPAVIAAPPPYERSRAAVAYEGTARRLAQSLKFQDRTDLAPWMAGWMVRAGREVLVDADLIVPVPLHRRRFMSRRFNQSAELGRAISRATGIAFAPELVVRIKRTRPQVGLKAREREENVRAAFRAGSDAKAKLAGRHVCIVDDVFTTGATVAAMAKCLRKAGAREISVLTFARVLPNASGRGGAFRQEDDRPI